MHYPSQVRGSRDMSSTGGVYALSAVLITDGFKQASMAIGSASVK